VLILKGYNFQRKYPSSFGGLSCFSPGTITTDYSNTDPASLTGTLVLELYNEEGVVVSNLIADAGKTFESSFCCC
jgi:hypothetical protein